MFFVFFLEGEEENGIIPMPLLPKKFYTGSQFSEFHKYTHERIEELNIIIPQKLQKREEEEKEEEDLKCRWCGAVFNGEELFRFHEGLHQQQTGSGEQQDPGYSFRKIKERTFRNSKAIDHHYIVKFNSDFVRKKEKVRDVQDKLAQLFDATLKQATENLRKSDLVRVIIHSDTLITSIVVPLRKIEDMSSAVVLNHVNHVLTSQEDMPVDESFYLDIGTVQVPAGKFVCVFYFFLR